MSSIDIIRQAEQDVKEQFEKIEDIRDYNQEKVLNAFLNNRVAPEHFYTVSGYGHDDLGRDVLDKVFADVKNYEGKVYFLTTTDSLKSTSKTA